jgi:hypothetical protein
MKLELRSRHKKTEQHKISNSLSPKKAKSRKESIPPTQFPAKKLSSIPVC